MECLGKRESPGMSENLELPLRLSKKPTVSPDEIEAVCAFLAGKGWMKAKLIEEQIAIDDRRMRVIAEHSDGRILSGQNGYRFFDRATPIDEVDQAASWLESQAKRMLQRAGSIRRRLHRFARDQVPA